LLELRRLTPHQSPPSYLRVPSSCTSRVIASFSDMASMYYVIALTLLLGVVSGQDIEKFQQTGNIIKPLVGEMVGNQYVCEVCENVVSFLQNVTENEEVLDEVVTLLLPVCEWVPYNMHRECLAFVDSIPETVKMYADMYLDPKTDCEYVCEQLASDGPRPATAKTVLNYLDAMKKTAEKYK